MFIGSINKYIRAVLETALRHGSGQAARGWRGRPAFAEILRRGKPVYVACSGKFTVERILAQCDAHAS